MILCSCNVVRPRDVKAFLPQLDAHLPLADIGVALGAAADCGSCIKDLRKILEGHKPTASLQTAAQIHHESRKILAYGDNADALRTLTQTNSTLYSVLSLENSLETAQSRTDLGDLNLFALGLDFGRELYINRKGLDSETWLQSLTQQDAEPYWSKAVDGSFNKWSPKKINRKGLLRFLVSEIQFARLALDHSPLQAIALLGLESSEILNFTKPISRIPTFVFDDTISPSDLSDAIHNLTTRQP